jgi:hypothetical protein
VNAARLGGVPPAGTLDTHAPVDAGGGISWILVGGIGIPAAVFVGFFIGMPSELNAFPLQDHGNHGARGSA